MHLAVIAALAPHPIQMHRQLPRHGYFGDLPSTPHGQMEELAAPLRLAAHRDLRRFHQQKPQQHVALLADVSQSTSVSAGLLLGKPARHNWPVACRSESAPAFRSPTRKPVRLVVPLRDESSAVALPDASPPPLLTHESVPGSSALVGRVSRAGPAAAGWPTAPVRSIPVPCGPPDATALSSAAGLRSVGRHAADSSPACASAPVDADATTVAADRDSRRSAPKSAESGPPCRSGAAEGTNKLRHVINEGNDAGGFLG